MCLRRKMVQSSRVSFVVLVVAGLTIVALSANAAPVHRKPAYHKKPVARYAPPARYVRTLPYGYRTFIHGGLTYYFVNGHFYHHNPSGYAVVTPPVGATIQFLPEGAVPVTIGKARYYRVSEVYFQKKAGGYMIVSPPIVLEASAWNPAQGADRVRVTVPVLNVRSGPGMDRPVINKVRKGDVLEVQATGSGWYYVQLPDNTSGWVMEAYTTLLESNPLG